jgi:hypothetical protein
MSGLVGLRHLQFVEERENAAADRRTLFVEDFRHCAPGMWNDGVGSASRDTNMTFNGMPSCRLDTQGNSGAGLTSPGRTASTSGVVFKRRIHDNFSGVFGVEVWFRFTSLNITSNTYPCLSVYNRDGVDAWHGRLWLDPNGNNQPLVGRVLDGAATKALNGGDGRSGTLTSWRDVATIEHQYAGGSHLYDISAGSGRGDKVGGWHYAALFVDLDAKRYRRAQVDNIDQTDLGGFQLDQTASAGAAMMHFSFEFMASTATRRYMHIANVRGFGY